MCRILMGGQRKRETVRRNGNHEKMNIFTSNSFSCDVFVICSFFHQIIGIPIRIRNHLRLIRVIGIGIQNPDKK